MGSDFQIPLLHNVKRHIFRRLNGTRQARSLLLILAWDISELQV